VKKLEISSEVIEQIAHGALVQALRDLYPQGLDSFYPAPPELEQVVADAIRWRYFCTRNAQEWFGRATATAEDLDAEIDKRINEEFY